MDPELKARLRGLSPASREYQAAIDAYNREKAAQREREVGLRQQEEEQRAAREERRLTAERGRAAATAREAEERQNRERIAREEAERQTAMVTAASTSGGLAAGVAGGDQGGKQRERGGLGWGGGRGKSGQKMCGRRGPGARWAPELRKSASWQEPRAGSIRHHRGHGLLMAMLCRPPSAVTCSGARSLGELALWLAGWLAWVPTRHSAGRQRHAATSSGRYGPAPGTASAAPPRSSQRALSTATAIQAWHIRQRMSRR